MSEMRNKNKHVSQWNKRRYKQISAFEKNSMSKFHPMKKKTALVNEKKRIWGGKERSKLEPVILSHDVEDNLDLYIYMQIPIMLYKDVFTRDSELAHNHNLHKNST